ncbi:MAG: LEA type 2 family protein [Myxococcota bacterium]
MWKSSCALPLLPLIACASGSNEPLPPPEVKVERIIPSTQSLREANVRAKIRITNPRELPVTIAKVEYLVRTENLDTPIEGRSTLTPNSELPGKSAAEVELSQDLAFPEAAEAFLAAAGKEEILVQMEGAISFGDGTSASFIRKGSIAPPNLPRFVVHEAQSSIYEGEGIDVTFYLRLINENPFSVVVENASYEIVMSGKKVAEGTAGIGIRLTQGAVQEYEVNVTVDETSFGKGWKSMLDQESLSYSMTGELVMENFNLPVEQNGSIDLN